jgi:hypothetical protein
MSSHGHAPALACPPRPRHADDHRVRAQWRCLVHALRRGPRPRCSDAGRGMRPRSPEGRVRAAQRVIATWSRSSWGTQRPRVPPRSDHGGRRVAVEQAVALSDGPVAHAQGGEVEAGTVASREHGRRRRRVVRGQTRGSTTAAAHRPSRGPYPTTRSRCCWRCERPAARASRRIAGPCAAPPPARSGRTGSASAAARRRGTSSPPCPAPPRATSGVAASG